MSQQARPAPYPSSGASLAEPTSLSIPPRPGRYDTPKRVTFQRVEFVSLLASVGVRVAKEGEVRAVGWSLSAPESISKSEQWGAVPDGGADFLARCLAGMLNKKAVALIFAQFSRAENQKQPQARHEHGVDTFLEARRTSTEYAVQWEQEH